MNRSPKCSPLLHSNNHILLLPCATTSIPLSPVATTYTLFRFGKTSTLLPGTFPTSSPYQRHARYQRQSHSVNLASLILVTFTWLNALLIICGALSRNQIKRSSGCGHGIMSHCDQAVSAFFECF
jgi:hypothetical protein